MNEQTTYLKCKICGAFYEANMEHTCERDYSRNRQVSSETAEKIKNIINQKLYGKPYDHNDPKLYSYYEKVIGIARLNLKIPKKYPWDKKDADRILKESKRLLGNYAWHDLATNPDDLPTDENERVLVKVVWDSGDSDYYTDYYHRGHWMNDNATLNGTVTKWRHIEHD